MTDSNFIMTTEKPLTGPQKAAIFLADLDSSTCKMVLKKLSKDERAKVVKAIKEIKKKKFFETYQTLPTENAVLIEAIKKGILLGIATPQDLITTSPQIQEKKIAIKNQFQQDPETFAKVLGALIASDKQE